MPHYRVSEGFRQWKLWLINDCLRMNCAFDIIPPWDFDGQGAPMNWNRLLSGMLALVYVVVSAIIGGAEPAFKMAFATVFPLACIWFADYMGGYVGPTSNMAITKASPGWLVCVLGWVLLVMPLVYVVITVFETKT
jgi:hypothetical protein